jgi:taurine--2-oxoglutarate transaminase
MSKQIEAPTNATLPHFGQMGSDRLSIDDGDGTVVYDTDGDRYLDFTSQLYCVNAGHGNETVLGRMREQLERVQYVSSEKHNDTRTRFASRLVEVAPANLEDVFFSVTGSEANEAAMMIARELQEGNTVLSRWRSYHGSTYGTAPITGDSRLRNAIESGGAMGGATKFLPPFRGADAAFDADSEAELAERAADHLEYVIRNQGPDSIAALITELVAGSSGALTAPEGYFARVRELCDEYDIMLIADEVITGFGRCGDWFAAQTEALQPDMITFAKGVTSAYVPMAGVLTSGEIGRRLREAELEVGQTFAGNPIGCAAGLGALEAYGDGLIDNVRENTEYMESRIRDLEHHDVVGQISGRGYLWGIEMVDDRGEPIFDPRVDDGDNPIVDVADLAKADGVLIGAGRPGFQAMLAPPLCTTRGQVDEAVEVVDDAIAAVFG